MKLHETESCSEIGGFTPDLDVFISRIFVWPIQSLDCGFKCVGARFLQFEIMCWVQVLTVIVEWLVGPRRQVVTRPDSRRASSKCSCGHQQFRDGHERERSHEQIRLQVCRRPISLVHPSSRLFREYNTSASQLVVAIGVFTEFTSLRYQLSWTWACLPTPSCCIVRHEHS